MPRCSSCNKFCSLDEADPEIGTLEIDEDGNISGDARIANNCAECGQEVTEATVDLEGTHEEAGKHISNAQQKGKHELSVEEEGAERTQRSQGKGRGCRTYYGVEVEVKVACSCGKEFESTTAKGEVQASGMDEVG